MEKKEDTAGKKPLGIVNVFIANFPECTFRLLTEFYLALASIYFPVAVKWMESSQSGTNQGEERNESQLSYSRSFFFELIGIFFLPPAHSLVASFVYRLLAVCVAGAELIEYWLDPFTGFFFKYQQLSLNRN